MAIFDEKRRVVSVVEGCNCFPRNAAGISAASSATANTFGSAVEVIPINTVTSDFVLTHMIIRYPDVGTVPGRIIIRINEGAGDTEITRVLTGVSDVVNYEPYGLPLGHRLVAANSRISVQIMDNIATAFTYTDIKLVYYLVSDISDLVEEAGSYHEGKPYLKYGSSPMKTYPDTTAGVAVTAVASWGSPTGWTEIVPVNTINKDIIIKGISTFTTGSAQGNYVELGVGGAGVEVVTVRSVTPITTGANSCSVAPVPDVFVTKNTRIAARISTSGATTANNVIIWYQELPL